MIIRIVRRHVLPACCTAVLIPAAALLTGLAAWLALTACGFATTRWQEVLLPTPPGSSLAVSLFCKPVHPVMAEYAQYVRVTGAVGNDTFARDYPMRLNSGGQFKVNVYLLPADAGGGPYFRFEEVYGHYLLDLAGGAWYLLGPPMETTTFDRQRRPDILYYQGTDIPTEVSLLQADGVPAGTGADFAEDGEEKKMFAGALTERTGRLVYGGTYYGRVTVNGFTPAATAAEQKIEVFIDNFSPRAKKMTELVLPCPGADSSVVYRYMPHGPGNSGIKIIGENCDLVADFSLHGDFRANLFAYPASRSHGPLLRLVNSRGELLIEPGVLRIQPLLRARGKVYVGERLSSLMGTQERPVFRVTVGDRPALPAPAAVAAGPGTYLGRVDVVGETPVFIPAATAAETAIPRPQIYMRTLDWPYTAGASVAGEEERQQGRRTR